MVRVLEFSLLCKWFMVLDTPEFGASFLNQNSDVGTLSELPLLFQQLLKDTGYFY